MHHRVLLLDSHPLTRQALPKCDSEINDAFRAAMRRAHPDRNFGSREATELSQQLLAARAIIKKAMLKGVAPDVDCSMAG